MLCLVPKPAIVVKFPRPDTADDEYTAPDGTCFKVKPLRVECGKDGTPVLPQPIAEHNTPGEPGLTFRNPLERDS